MSKLPPKLPQCSLAATQKVCVAVGLCLSIVLFCCACIKMPLAPLYSSRSIMLGILFYLVNVVYGVCYQCHGKATAEGCTGDAATCPWVTGVSANTAVIAGTGTAVTLVLSKLLPVRWLRLFTPDVLKCIVNIAKHPTNKGTPIDLSTKSGKEVLDLYTSGGAKLNDCIARIMDLIEIETTSLGTATDTTRPGIEAKLKLLSARMDALKTATPDKELTTSTGYLDGVFMYILAKLSSIVCGGRNEDFNLCIQCDEDGDGPGRGSSSSSSS